MHANEDPIDVLKEVRDRLIGALFGESCDLFGSPTVPSGPVRALADAVAGWLAATAEAAPKPKPEPAPIEISFCPRTLLAETGHADARPRAVIVTTPGGKITLTVSLH